MQLSELHLTALAVMEHPSDRDFEVIGAKESHGYDDSGKPNETITGYSLTVRGFRGSKLVVKLPLDLADRVVEVKEKLDNGSIIRVSFKKLDLKAYAMNRNERLLSGVSAKALDFVVTAESVLEDEEFDL